MLRLNAPDSSFARSFDQKSAPAAHPLLPRWARVAALGLARDNDGQAVGVSRGELRERRNRLADVFREEETLIAPITEELAAQALCVVIADGDGIVLSVRDGGVFSTAADRARLVEGSDWSESARGTNGIGTSIVERAPVAVIGSAHYEARNAGLFCYATPVFDARGDLAAVIDVSGPLPRHDEAVGVAVRLAGASLERSLRAAAYARVGFGNFAIVERLVFRSRTPALLIESRGPVRLCNEIARRDVLEGRSGVDCVGLFGIEFSALAELARRGRELRFETRDKMYGATLDPVLDGSGRVLGVVVHLEPAAASHAQVAATADRARASETPAASRGRERSREGASLPPSFDAIYAIDPAVVRAKEAAAAFAPTAAPVLLVAEAGTGKRLFARAMHAASSFATGPFIALSCRAISEDLLERELRATSRERTRVAVDDASRSQTLPGGVAPTPEQQRDATNDAPLGLLASASGGTLFLDEISEMPERLQGLLLRALDDETRYVEGDFRAGRLPFRLIAGSSRDLPALVEAGSFRRDLFYRIHGASLTIPPLRKRADRTGLAESLLQRLRVTPPALGRSAIDYIESHTWPGNVRELKLALANALTLRPSGHLEREHFPRNANANAGNRAATAQAAGARTPSVPAIPAPRRM